MNEIKLKPCPFCGHVARIMPYLGKFYAQCRRRDCHIRTEPQETEERAAEIWNRRVSDCGQCGRKFCVEVDEE